MWEAEMGGCFLYNTRCEKTEKLKAWITFFTPRGVEESEKFKWGLTFPYAPRWKKTEKFTMTEMFLDPEV